MTVDVDELEVGQARGWDRTRDVGNGSIHCHVSGLGQWACASGRNVKPPEVTRVPAK